MENNTPSVPNIAPSSKINIWFAILALVVVIFSTILIFLYLQTKKVVTTTPNTTNNVTDVGSSVVVGSPTLKPSEKSLYTFKCPENSKYVSADIKKGETPDNPQLQITCVDNVNPNNKVSFYMLAIDVPQVSLPEASFEKQFDSSSGKLHILIRGGDKDYFDKVIAGFKFSE